MVSIARRLRTNKVTDISISSSISDEHNCTMLLSCYRHPDWMTKLAGSTRGLAVPGIRQFGDVGHGIYTGYALFLIN